jgi:hypothetical protein
MKRYILLGLIFFQSFSVLAQVYDRKVIHADENISDHFTYRFPSFEEATVLFKNGTSSIYKMNFNMLLCSMQFIDPKGDTLNISKPADIDSILFKNSTFFFRDNYFEILSAYNSVKLVVSRKASFEPVKIGAMGMPSRNGAIDNYDSYSSDDKQFNTPIKLRINQNINSYQKIEFFIIGNNGEFMKASKNSFLKICGNDKKSSEKFIQLNKIKFNNQDDLKKLFDFCTHA